MQNNNKNRMLPLGQYASINSCERYNPLLEDAYKLEIGSLPPTKDTNKAERDVATATSENNKEVSKTYLCQLKGPLKVREGKIRPTLDNTTVLIS